MTQRFGPGTITILALLSAGFVVACSSDGNGSTGSGVTGDSGAVSTSEKDAGDAATATDAAPLTEAPLGTCTFGEVGSTHASPAGDVSTFGIRNAQNLTLQCGSNDGTKIYTLNLGFSEVTGPGTFTKGAAQYSEQSSGGGSPTSYKSFKASLVLTTLTETNAAGSIAFQGDTMSGDPKRVTASFNLPLRK